MTKLGGLPPVRVDPDIVFFVFLPPILWAAAYFTSFRDFRANLRPILLLAGLIRLLAGVARLGQWFRAISPAVVHGMLAGIGVLIVAGQLHVMLDAKPLPHGLANILAVPAAYGAVLPLDGVGAEVPLAIGLLTIVSMVGWEKLRPARLKLVPGALVGVGLATAVSIVLELKVAHVRVPASLAGSISMPSWADMALLLSPKVVLSAFAIAFIASAETLLSAAAVDRMHDGVRTNYNRELSAQGVGNMLCGVLGGLPMTGVIVRSSANVQAGAATRASAVLHGLWLLAAVAALPWALRAIPMAALAGVLVVTGWRLVSLVHFRHLLGRYGLLPAGIWAATLATVVATDLLTGVLVGIALSALEILPVALTSRLLVRVRAWGADDAPPPLARLPVVDLFRPDLRRLTGLLFLLVGLNFFAYQAFAGWVTTFLKEVKGFDFTKQVLPTEFVGLEEREKRVTTAPNDFKHVRELVKKQVDEELKALGY